MIVQGFSVLVEKVDMDLSPRQLALNMCKTTSTAPYSRDDDNFEVVL
jgi:hypothetical protein